MTARNVIDEAGPRTTAVSDPVEGDAPILAVEDLTVRYGTRSGEVTAVDAVSFALGHGERVALVGESGSGKSTLGLALAGFLTQDNVHVECSRLDFAGAALDRDTRSRLPRRTPGLSMIFQDAMTTLDPVWPIGSQLRAVIRAAGRADGGGRPSRADVRERARYWLDRVGLRDTERVLRARPYELSGGMRQRAMIAIALCGGPKLLIADEPTSALDASLAREAMETMLTLTGQSSTSVLVISHDILLAQEYTDRTFVMYGGRIVEQRTSARLVDTATHPYTVALLRCVPTLASAELDELPTLASVNAEITGVDEPTEVTGTPEPAAKESA
ncbi:ABC transporter ATP-binding protein [Frankia sp. AgKG'84/4]|uniref:ABC transporter ATP-binding protein n=1 Tax=Frankia sp. AgKG'84/4 TaxID=573490 RepID=UPI00200D986A|nr:ABC transporter ATP-binding protein [Frankia sp. AgKG'84/4]MCL9794464.1 ABC transporter ATP-binding protein [Frankia sp. AgKG'84/4]